MLSAACIITPVGQLVLDYAVVDAHQRRCAFGSLPAIARRRFNSTWQSQQSANARSGLFSIVIIVDFVFLFYFKLFLIILIYFILLFCFVLFFDFVLFVLFCFFFKIIIIIISHYSC